MNEPIQQQGQELSIVIYDSPLPPRYLRFSKKFIHAILIVIPLLLGSIIIGLFFWGLSSRVNSIPLATIPTVIDDSSKITELESEIKSLQKSTQILQDKLATNDASSAGQDEVFLMGIKRPYGMQNFVQEKKVALDQFEFSHTQDKVLFKFQIISSIPETKVAGHIIVFMVSSSGLTAYPNELNLNFESGIKYNMGEHFAVSRLRPTSTQFNLPAGSESVKFFIYIFSRAGDLLMVKQTDPYKLGAK